MKLEGQIVTADLQKKLEGALSDNESLKGELFQAKKSAEFLEIEISFLKSMNMHSEIRDFLRSSVSGSIRSGRRD
jgi:hypothetical protein